ncbi:DUF2147 domain-containing protein [Flavimarina sp. Hel_I_48]|uniref:DUF2147 domain-containing protein n=1 Tax=Flavimarina sp. Hel_I_48 TaxID=1392488 RepID=UPI0004DF6EDF|nr:DUF2147 domain-containing protein [Flavimarina sp. Hel_I_48]
MKKNILLLSVLLFSMVNLMAQDVTGKWKTIDDQTGDAKSIVEIYKQDGKVYGKIVELINPKKKNAKCTECPGDDKGKPLTGLMIIRGLEKDGDEYSDGKILDPISGKLYKCYIALENPDRLKVRGYVGFSLLGRTQYWSRLD